MAQAVGLPADKVLDVAPATVDVDVVPADGAVETNTVTLDFHVAADAYDPETSPAAYAAALAAKMGVSPEDVTVHAHQEEDGTWTIKAVVDAGEDPAVAQDKAEKANAPDFDLAGTLGLPADKVQVGEPAKAGTEFVAAEGAAAKNSVSLDFMVTDEAYDPTTSP